MRCARAGRVNPLVAIPPPTPGRFSRSDFQGRQPLQAGESQSRRLLQVDSPDHTGQPCRRLQQKSQSRRLLQVDSPRDMVRDNHFSSMAQESRNPAAYSRSILPTGASAHTATPPAAEVAIPPPTPGRFSRETQQKAGTILSPRLLVAIPPPTPGRFSLDYFANKRTDQGFKKGRNAAAYSRSILPVRLVRHGESIVCSPLPCNLLSGRPRQSLSGLGKARSRERNSCVS